MHYRYRTVTIERTPERDIDLDVEPTFQEQFESHYQYVNGPAVWTDPDTGRVQYTFLFRQATGRD